ncbi:phage tail protein [Desulfovibrio sp. OttesenSCG-928-G15]|nr:phage tail protein [Desulfovibrio sp. OttesenSCG-928-G15]
MQNKPPLDDIVVRIGGNEHNIWTHYEIDSDFLTPADAWRVSLGVPVADSPADLSLWQQVTVSAGGETILTGRLDRARHRIAKGNHDLELNGRDLTGVLVDCSAPIFSAQTIDFATLIETIVKPLGIANVDIRTKGLRQKVSIEPGMTAWEALQTACELNGCHAWFAPDGTLIVGGPDYTSDPVGELILDRSSDKTNVISLDIDPGIEEYYSEVTVLAQAHGTAKQRAVANIKARVEDDVLKEAGIYRPLIVVDGDAESADYAQKKARKLLADSRLSALTITAEVRGHRAFDEAGQGPLWEPGQRVYVNCPVAGLDGIYFLMRRTFIGGIDGQRTRLELKEDGIWLPDVATQKAKAAKGAGKKRKSRKRKGKKGKKGKKSSGPLQVIVRGNV